MSTNRRRTTPLRGRAYRAGAAILAITGYSVNDTIVIFDRVRENSHLLRRESLEKIVNDSELAQVVANLRGRRSSQPAASSSGGNVPDYSPPAEVGYGHGV